MEWITGALQSLRGSGRFWLMNQKEQLELTSGRPLEIQYCGQWLRGRVEFSDHKGYYWTNDNQALELGNVQRARIWPGPEWPNREYDRGR